MVASSIAFSAFLSLIPLLVLVALAYGALADPREVASDLRALVRVVPLGARAAIEGWLAEGLFRRDGRGAGLALSTALTLFSAGRAGRSLLYGLNIAYRVEHRRNFLARRLLAVAIAAGVAGLGVGALVLVSAVALVSRYVPDVPFGSKIARAFLWSAAATVTCVMSALLYRHGPAREPPALRAVAPGAVVATALSLSGTWLLSAYLARFGELGRLYGSLGAVVALQLWLLGVALVFLFGARLNADLAGDDSPLGR